VNHTQRRLIFDEENLEQRSPESEYQNADRVYDMNETNNSTSTLQSVHPVVSTATLGDHPADALTGEHENTLLKHV
jgi:hypothetical protein